MEAYEMRRLFQPASACMVQLYDGGSAGLRRFIQYYEVRGWKFLGAVTVADFGDYPGDWSGAYTSTFVYFE